MWGLALQEQGAQQTGVCVPGGTMSPLCERAPSVTVPGLSSNTSGLLLGFSVHWDEAGSELLPDHVLGQDTGAVAKPQPPRGLY